MVVNTYYIYSLGSVIIVSLISFVGVFTLSLKREKLRKYLFLLISLAAGALIGDAFIHLIPEAFEEIGNATLAATLIIAGILIFFILEKILHWHHHAVESHGEETVHPTGKMILVSDGVHNFIDGVLITGSYFVSIELGIATTIAVILHEVPQEIGDFGVLLHSGFSALKALWLNFISALFALLGAILTLLVGNKTQEIVFWLLPITAGGFIYIALSDLMPELHKTKPLAESLMQTVALALGILIMLLLVALE